LGEKPTEATDLIRFLNSKNKKELDDVGTREALGYSSNNAPKRPNYWPFGNTCKADAVSPEIAIGGCRTHVSTTRGNESGIKETTYGDHIILSKNKPTFHSYISDLTY
jgi:hypothetical protein